MWLNVVLTEFKPLLELQAYRANIGQEVARAETLGTPGEVDLVSALGAQK